MLTGAVVAHAKCTATGPFKPNTKGMRDLLQGMPCRSPVCLQRQIPVAALIVKQFTGARSGCQQRAVVIDNVPDMLANNLLLSGTEALPVKHARHLVEQLDKLTDRISIFFNDPVQGPVTV
jgi:hypothetical protein